MNLKRSGMIQGATALLAVGFLYLPLAVVIVYSVNANRYGIRWGGFTFQWYRALLGDSQVWSAAGNTLVLALASTAVATVLGSMLGYGLSRFRWKGQPAFEWMLLVPVFLPDIAMAAALLLFFSLVRQWIGWFGLGLGAMVLGHVTFQIPFVVMIVRSRMAGMDPALEEAARDLGADGWAVFWKITFPLIWPGILAGALLAFTLSLDDFVVSFFTSGPGSTTLPIFIYASVKRGLSPEINAISTLIVLASIGAVLGAARVRKSAQAAA